MRILTDLMLRGDMGDVKMLLGDVKMLLGGVEMLWVN